MRLSHEAVNEQQAERFNHRGRGVATVMLRAAPDHPIIHQTGFRPKLALCESPLLCPRHMLSSGSDVQETPDIKRPLALTAP